VAIAWQATRKAFDKAIELDPNNAEVVNKLKMRILLLGARWHGDLGVLYLMTSGSIFQLLGIQGIRTTAPCLQSKEWTFG